MSGVGTWRSRAALWPALLLGAFVWLAVSVAAARAADPRQCVADVGRAIDAADAAAFERLVDVDAILDAALTLFLRDAQKPEIAARSEERRVGKECRG